MALATIRLIEKDGKTKLVVGVPDTPIELSPINLPAWAVHEMTARFPELKEKA